jgi:hypothetical protein
MGENGYTLRRACKLPVHLVDESGHDFDPSVWPWTETNIHVHPYDLPREILLTTHYYQ